MGVGKTALCRELQKVLPGCVFLDGDWCWDMRPFIVTAETQAMALNNIVYMLNSFLSCSAYENILFCWVLHKREILEELLSRLALRDAKVEIIYLVCSREALERRLQKDVDAGLRQADVIERSLERLPLYDTLPGRKIDVSTLTPQETARLLKEERQGVYADLSKTNPQKG